MLIKRAFRALWRDFVKTLKYHYFAIIGFLISVVVPLALLGTEIVTKSSKSWQIQLAALPIGIFLIIWYWAKLRGWIKSKKTEERMALKLGSANASPFMLIATSALDNLMSIGTAFFIYYLAICIERLAVKFSVFMLIFSILIALGSLCYIMDTLLSVGRSYGKDEK